MPDMTPRRRTFRRRVVRVAVEEEDDMIDQAEAARVELAAMTGAWRSLASRWDLTWKERRALFPKGGEEGPSPCADTETRMRVLVEIGHRVGFDGEEEEREWLRQPIEMLGWYAPIEVMSGALGDLRRFRAFVEQGLGS